MCRAHKFTQSARSAKSVFLAQTSIRIVLRKCVCDLLAEAKGGRKPPRVCFLWNRLCAPWEKHSVEAELSETGGWGRNYPGWARISSEAFKWRGTATLRAVSPGWQTAFLFTSRLKTLSWTGWALLGEALGTEPLERCSAQTHLLPWSSRTPSFHSFSRACRWVSYLVLLNVLSIFHVSHLGLSPYSPITCDESGSARGS